MKVILKPLSHAAMGEIVIVDSLYAIGRQEPPFVSQPGNVAAKLSKRHAKIFQENGKVYVADLGSLNGTLVNQQQLKNDAVEIKSRDVLTFGSEFRFEVQLQAEPVKSAAAAVLAPLRLILAPATTDGEVESIVIDKFPFLVARVDGVFAHYQNRFPDDLRKISRRHAVIARNGDDVSVEDLDSSNGTFVGGERLDERARPLHNDDVVSFGSDRFAYRVMIERVAAPVSDAALALTLFKPVTADLTGTDKTRFVSSATSFLDVFCADDKPVTDAKGPDIAATAAVKVLAAPKSPLERGRAIMTQMWSALVGKSGVDGRVTAILGGVVALIVLAALVSWALGGGKREIKSLLDSGSYAASAAAANEYLEDKPDDYDAEAWGETALAKDVVPAWLKLVEARKFEDATTFVRQQKEKYRFIKRGQEMLDMLAWTGRVEAHLADRGGANSNIVMFRHEDVIKSLVDEWDVDSFRHQQLLGQIVGYEPAFEPIHARVFSTLRTLRNENALYVKAITQLKQDAGKALDSGNRTQLSTIVSEFAGNYPRVQGIDKLQADLVKLDTLTSYVTQRQLADIVEFNRTVRFETPLVAQHVRKWLATALPPPDVMSSYAQASDAWGQGDRDRAISILQPLEGAAWGEVAKRQIERYQQVTASYEELQAARGTKEYQDRLVAFSATLKPAEDQNLIKAIQPDLLVHKEQLVGELSGALRRTQALWDAYQNANGISGVVRVEERITEKFRSQAQRLSAAAAEIVRGNRTYQLLQIEQPLPWKTVSAEVLSEARRQRRWLQDLNIILEPSLLQSKLSLLPDIPESTP